MQKWWTAIVLLVLTQPILAAAPPPQSGSDQVPPLTDDQLASKLIGRWGTNPSCADFFVDFRSDGVALFFEKHGRVRRADWGPFSIIGGELTVTHMSGRTTTTRISFDHGTLVGAKQKGRPMDLVRCTDQPQ